jgi:hypothetical protein
MDSTASALPEKEGQINKLFKNMKFLFAFFWVP